LHKDINDNYQKNEKNETSEEKSEKKIRIEEVMFDRPSCEYNRMTSYLHLGQTAPAASGYE
jgi:hypothetical protein